MPQTTVGDVLEQLQNLVNCVGPDVPFLAAIQPNYPLAVGVVGLFVQRDGDNNPKAVLITTSNREPHGYDSPYAPRAAFSEENCDDDFYPL